MSIKKSLFTLQNGSVPDVEEQRSGWDEIMSEYPIENLVLLDEGGVNTDMTRLYARALCGRRAVDSAPINTPTNTTILSSVQINVTCIYTTYSGGTTRKRFLEYLKTMVFPSLDKEAVIIMDNMRSHHAKDVKSILEQAGIRYLYLPPYSPDLNSIEKLWSKIKAYLRKEKTRQVEEFITAIKRVFNTIRLSDYKEWFCACGYMQ